MSGLLADLESQGLMNDSSPRLIDAIACFMGDQHDQWFCNDCLWYGGRDMPDIWICPGGELSPCRGCYCDDCLASRQYRCKCGEMIVTDEESDEAALRHTADEGDNIPSSR
jgi:hypothetical protein